MPTWVTIFGWVNHLSMEPGIQGYSAGILHDTPTCIHGIAVFAECLAVELACGDQRRLTGSSSTLEALHGDALYKSTYFYFFYSIFFLQPDRPVHSFL